MLLSIAFILLSIIAIMQVFKNKRLEERITEIEENSAIYIDSKDLKRKLGKRDKN